VRRYEGIAGAKRASWCGRNQLNARVMSRAIVIRDQLSKFLRRFKIPSDTAESEPAAIMRCIVTGYFANAATRQVQNVEAAKAVD
jgi:hypothetical protein